jgi:hypothetical protein
MEYPPPVLAYLKTPWKWVWEWFTDGLLIAIAYTGVCDGKIKVESNKVIIFKKIISPEYWILYFLML